MLFWPRASWMILWNVNISFQGSFGQENELQSYAVLWTDLAYTSIDEDNRDLGTKF